ncbi:MAG TPA: hypothetical protein VF194_07235 [Ferrovibrio sp.]|uniref:hypothetical protein n=1 Tax=Ferrovibrio sp. TaxID=1917215 RepID=UPI002ED6526A
MPKETTTLPADPAYRWLSAAAYLAVCAYPDELDKRDIFIAAVKAAALQALNTKPSERADWQPWAQERVRMRREQVEGRLNNAYRRLSTRLWAAKMGAPQLMPNNSGIMMKPGRRAGQIQIVIGRGDNRPRAGVRAWSTWVAMTRNHARQMQVGGQTQDKAISRVWSASKPVLHLSIPLLGEANSAAYGLNIMALVRHPGWLENALRSAEAFRGMAVARGLVREEQTIRLALKDAGS